MGQGGDEEKGVGRGEGMVRMNSVGTRISSGCRNSEFACCLNIIIALSVTPVHWDRWGRE